MNVVTEKT